MNKQEDKTIAKTEPDDQDPVRNDTAEMTGTVEAAVKMDRSAALKALGLPGTANAYAVDNRFWQLTKRYRAEKNDEKLKEVTDAYDVASGRAAEKDAEIKEYQSSKKFLGKTNAQWKVYFYYTWWK